MLQEISRCTKLFKTDIIYKRTGKIKALVLIFVRCVLTTMSPNFFAYNEFFTSVFFFTIRFEVSF